MNQRFIITGTDTDIGKTVFSAMLMLGINANYWKPVQAGVAEGIDTRLIQQMTGLPDERFLPEAYIFSEAFSPHKASAIDGVEIDLEKLAPPPSSRLLLIEGAGGLMVPMTRKNLQINLFRRWKLPVILCARTALGTINHTLLSIEALKVRDIPIHGIAFIGDDNEDNMNVIGELSGVKILGRMPWLQELHADSLRKAFDENFSASDFTIAAETANPA